MPRHRRGQLPEAPGKYIQCWKLNFGSTHHLGKRVSEFTCLDYILLAQNSSPENHSLFLGGCFLLPFSFDTFECVTRYFHILTENIQDSTHDRKWQRTNLCFSAKYCISRILPTIKPFKTARLCYSWGFCCQNWQWKILSTVFIRL